MSKCGNASLVHFQFLLGLRKNLALWLRMGACSGFGLQHMHLVGGKMCPLSVLHTDRKEAELYNKAKPKPKTSSQIWCANVTRKEGINFNVSHANTFTVSHRFVLQDAIKKKRTALRY